jgi:hypothetical protein
VLHFVYEFRESRSIDPGFRVAPAIASLPGMTIELWSELSETVR